MGKISPSYVGSGVGKCLLASHLAGPELDLRQDFDVLPRLAGNSASASLVLGTQVEHCVWS